MIALLFALLIGASLVVLGAGGSIVTMPVLVYAAGLDAHQAAGTSLLVVGLVAFVGAAAKWRQVQLRSALILGAAGTTGAIPGAWLNHAVPGTRVLVGFAATALTAAWQMLRNAKAQSRRSEAGCGLGLMLLSGFGLGVATGFFGVGGGFLIVPALTLIMGLDVDAATATSLLVIGLNSAAGLIGHMGYGAVEWHIGAQFAVTALLGGVLALPLARQLNGLRLQRAFAAVLAVVGISILVQSIGQWLA
jgi:hypothetical protein